jgi:hypothetical protein
VKPLSQLAAPHALPAVIGQGVSLRRNAGSDNNEVALEPAAFVRSVVAASEVYADYGLSHTQVDIESKLVSEQNDGVRSGNRSAKVLCSGKKYL